MKMKSILYLSALLWISCDDSKNTDPIKKPVEFSFDFAEGNDGWIGDFADYPQGSENFYELGFEHSTLPTPLDENNGALKQTGNNHSDDLFMFIKKEISGLLPGTKYKVTFTVEFASNVPDGLFGVGGSPGESVVIKAGATKIEPVKVLNEQNEYRMNIDKDNQTNSGKDMVVIGDFSNDTNEQIYTLKSISNQEPFEVTTTNSGKTWIVVGTDSGFEATTTIYYNKITIKLEPI